MREMLRMTRDKTCADRSCSAERAAAGANTLWCARPGNPNASQGRGNQIQVCVYKFQASCDSSLSTRQLVEEIDLIRSGKWDDKIRADLLGVPYPSVAEATPVEVVVEPEPTIVSDTLRLLTYSAF